MDCYKVGKLIHSLRRELGMTQKALADALHISDRTISKWERGLGCPDVSLLRELSNVLEVNLEILLSGDLESNTLNAGNMTHIHFYVCPICKSILFSSGDAEISCCGRRLNPLIVQPEDQKHTIQIEETADEIYVTVPHEMTKKHSLHFIAYVTHDCVTLVKLYPEQEAAAHFPKLYKGSVYVYCPTHGFFQKQLSQPLSNKKAEAYQPNC